MTDIFAQAESAIVASTKKTNAELKAQGTSRKAVLGRIRTCTVVGVAIVALGISLVVRFTLFSDKAHNIPVHVIGAAITLLVAVAACNQKKPQLVPVFMVAVVLLAAASGLGDLVLVEK
jgi:hypothetical protein